MLSESYWINTIGINIDANLYLSLIANMGTNLAYRGA